MEHINDSCKHRWGERINNTAVCKTCGAVALFDMEKDPFSESEPGILKPGKAQWDSLTLKQRKQALERSKNYILADRKKLGSKKARLRWGIKSTTWFGLMKRWLSPLEPPLKPPSGPARPGEYKQELPPLPTFDNNWPPEVQVKWLDAYLQTVARMFT